MTYSFTIPDFPTASVISTLRATAPEGWLLLNGLTIGNASSGASGRASADTEGLFLTLWNDTNAEVVGDRGESAAADHAASKELKLPNASGRVLAGKDLSGEVLADAEVLGTVLGSQTHALSLAETPNHEHGLNNSAMFDQGGSGVTQANAVPSSETGSYGEVDPPTLGAPHNNVQPTLVVNWIIKL